MAGPKASAIALLLALLLAESGLSAPPADAPRLDRHGDPLPPGAIARLGTLGLRHPGPVYAVAVSPDGKLLASSGGDRGVRLWQMATGRVAGRLEGDLGEVRWIAFSPDGKTLVLGDNQQFVRLWDAATGKEIGRLGRNVPVPGAGAPQFGEGREGGPREVFEGHQSGVRSAAFAPDGKTLVTASEDVRVWDLATRTTVRRNAQGLGGVDTVAFSPDGKVLALLSSSRPGTAYNDNVVGFWDAATGRELRRFQADGEHVHALAFGPDGRVLATAGQDNTVHLWDVATGRELRRLGGHPERVKVVAFAPDGKTLAAAAMSTIHLWDPATGKERTILRGHEGPLSGLAFTPDGKTLVSGSSGNGRICLWDLATGRLRPAPVAHEAWVGSVAFTPDSRTVVTSGGGTVRLWRAASGEPVRVLKAPQALGVACAPDGKTLAAGSYEYSAGYRVGLWDLGTGRLARQFGNHPQKVVHVAYSADGKVLASAGGNALYLWDAATGKERRRLSDFRERVYSLALSADGTLVAALDGKSAVNLWDGDTGKTLRFWWLATSAFTCVAISPDGTLLAAGAQDGCIYLDNRASESRSRRFSGHKAGVKALAFSPDGSVLASGCSEGTVLLWDVATGQELRRYAGPEAGITDIACSPDGRTLATGGCDANALVWDLTGRLRDGKLAGAELSPADLRRLWDDLAGDAVAAYDAVWALAASPRQAVPLLRQRLRPVDPADLRKLPRLIADLDHRRFGVREEASAALEMLGRTAEPALRRTLEGMPSVEVRRRINLLLEKLDEPTPAPERLRTSRALAALERAEGPEARQLLEELAQGADEAIVTMKARGALERLRRR